MLEELLEQGVGIPKFEVTTVNLGAGEQFSEEFIAICPNSRIPALQDGDVSLMESCAILQYLGETYPSSLLPTDDMRWEVLQWLYWQAANVGPVFGNKLSYTRYLTNVPEVQREHPLERFGNEAQRLLRVLNRQLASRDYVCADRYTIADIALYPWVRGWKWSKIDVTPHANVLAWIERIRRRPAVERGLQYGVPKEEVDQWSEDRKQSYARLGESIASPTS